MQFRKLYPFWIVFSIEFVFILYLILGHRGVIGDAYQYFTLQYYFLNNAAGTGDTAQWLPLVTHGTVANWWYGVQAGIVQSAMLALGQMNSIFIGSNFLPIYYLGILYDLGLLLLGVFLLARRYFTSNLTVLFVSITALGSAAWFTQTWFNLHFYYALPLIFHLVHVLFETGKWRYCLLAGNLFAVQCRGTLPYLVPFSALVVCLYAFFYIAFFWKRAKVELSRLALNWRNAVVPLLLVIASLYFVNGMLTHGTEEIANYSPGRTLDGRTESLEAFLTYGTNSNFRWAELVSRISPALDYSLYLGYLPLVLAALALGSGRKPAFLMVASTTLVVWLVASSTPLASLFYFVWPKMQFFRHLGLASTIVRLLLCFLAGFGFERMLVTVSQDDRARTRMAVILLIAWSGFLLAFSYDYPYAEALIWLSVSGALPLDPRVFGQQYLTAELFQSSLWCVIAAGFLVLLLWGRVPRKWLAIGAIVVQALDIYSFKFDLARFRTTPLTQGQYDITRFQSVPYSARRSTVAYDAHSRGKNVPQNKPRIYSTVDLIYWTQDLIMFTDPPSNIGRADHWLLSLDDFLRTYSGERIRDLAHKPKAFRPKEPLSFPFEKPNAQKLAGVSEDKIQFFSRAYFVETDQKISEMMASQAFSGDVLLLSGPNGGSPVPLQTNERLQRDYSVIQYDADDIRISVADANQGDWLYYADCWHPFWSVTVNGKDAGFYKANLAYKAVQLEQGQNIVHFRFHSRRLSFFMSILNWNAFLWVFFPVCLLWRTPDLEVVNLGSKHFQNPPQSG